MKEREMEEMEEAVEGEDSKELEKLEGQFFHHYTGNENNATANTILLFKHLYCCDPNKFFRFLKELLKEKVKGFEPDSSSGQVVFELQKRNTEGAQEKNKEKAQESPQESQEGNIEDIQKEGNPSIPDACISQANFFKIVIETKLSGNSFEDDQLIRHLRFFGAEEHKILVTLAPSKRPKEKLKKFESSPELKEKAISHCNLTFSDLVSAMEEVKLDVVYEVKMSDVFEDYKDYCEHDNLFSDSWRKLMLRNASKKDTYDFNVKNNVYYRKVDDKATPHDYLGLFRYDKEKKTGAIRAIGKICTQVVCDGINEPPVVERGELTEEHKRIIKDVAKRLGDNIERRYFFVEEFYETNYEKESPGNFRSSKLFDLKDILEVKNEDTMPSVEDIAEILKGKTWDSSDKK